LKDFYSTHPDINLSVIATTDMINFDSDPFDAAIRMGKGDWNDLLSYRLFNREIVAVCHPSLLENNEKLQANKKQFTPLEISNQSLVSNSSMPGLWKEWFQSAQIDIRDGTRGNLQLQNSAQVVEVLQTADSIGLIDRNFIKSDIKSGRLAIACEHVLQGANGYYLTAPKSAESLPSFWAFKDWLGTHSDINFET
jgi:LysR family glycine cleavage system transcriptional activator